MDRLVDYSPRLRVVFVNDIAFVVETLMQELENHSIDVHIVGRRSPHTSYARAPFLENLTNIHAELKAVGPFDILHINYGLFGLFALNSDRPSILHCHGSDIRPASGFKARIANIVTKLSARVATRVWYSTTDMAPYFEKMTVPHRYMPSPVADAFFNVRAALPSHPHVLFAVPLMRLKGAESAILAMQTLCRTKGTQISAFAFGPNGREVAELRRRIPKPVSLVSWTPHEQMPQMLSRASVIVGRLGLGSLGVTELEAMASCRPLVAYQKGSIRELEPYYRVDPPIVSCNSAEQVVEAVRACLENPAMACELGEKGRAWARRHHSPAVVAGLYEDEYRNVLDNA